MVFFYKELLISTAHMLGWLGGLMLTEKALKNGANWCVVFEDSKEVFKILKSCKFL